VFVFAIAAAAVAIVASQAIAFAGADPYSGGSAGYDFSYRQCGAAASRAAFGVVGVNAGYPFTHYNPCLDAEFAAAARSGNAALYVNTGYDPKYTAIDGRHTTQACSDASSSVTGTVAQQAAWAVGCSEAEHDVAYASSHSAYSPVMWWLDVESANSWSTSDLSLNRFTLRGLIDRLRAATSAPIGVYSTARQWQSITGGYHPTVDAEWLAIGYGTAKRASASCSSTGFAGVPVWLVQFVTLTDHDYAC
jgi:hypothetical protein